MICFMISDFYSIHFLNINLFLSRDGGNNIWPSWRCCKIKLFLKNSKNLHGIKQLVTNELCHCQKLFFVKMFVILLQNSFCFVKLTELNPNCQDFSVWISIFPRLVGYIFPNLRQRTKLDLLKIWSSRLPWGLGKTQLFFEKLGRNTFHPNIKYTIFYTGKWSK